MAEFCPLQGQSSTLDLQIPEVDRLPSWYFEQPPGQTIGISLTEGKIDLSAAMHQAVYFALFQAALQQSDTNVINGQVISTSEISKSPYPTETTALSISASLQIPTHYTVLDQCRLKNGPILILLQYQYHNLSSTEKLEFEFTNRIINDSIVEERFAINGEQYAVYCTAEHREGTFYRKVVQATEANYNEFNIALNPKRYGSIMRNRHLLSAIDNQQYLGSLYFDDLRQELYRKLIYRNSKRYKP